MGKISLKYLGHSELYVADNLKLFYYSMINGFVIARDHNSN